VNAARLRPLAHTNVLPHHDIWFTKLTTSMAATDRPTDRPTHTASRARRLCLRASRCVPGPPRSLAHRAARHSVLSGSFRQSSPPRSVNVISIVSVGTNLPSPPLVASLSSRPLVACVASGHATTARQSRATRNRDDANHVRRSF